jgi:hypothetical protein
VADDRVDEICGILVSLSARERENDYAVTKQGKDYARFVGKNE